MPYVLATCSLVLLLWISVLPVSADQVRIANYNAARDIFWNQLYPNGGTTLYCGEPFARQNTTLNVEHVYAASWMTKFLGCGSRTQCRRTSGRFNHMEADLHNLYPDLEVTNAARSDFRFTVIPGERPTVRPTCDFEHDKRQRLVEPRPEVRGDIARALLYMEFEYGAPLDPTMRALMVQWHHEDPPTDAERARNEQIEMLEGKRNPFIDQPHLVAPPPIPPGPLSPALSTAGGGSVRGNKASKLYHRPDCPGYASIAERNRVELASEAEAQQAGYRKATNCP
jgi:deoxyribonuclease-1